MKSNLSFSRRYSYSNLRFTDVNRSIDVNHQDEKLTLSETMNVIFLLFVNEMNKINNYCSKINF